MSMEMAPRLPSSGVGAYAPTVALLNWAVTHWAEFDGWCCARGIDPLELPSRRLVNLIRYFIMEPLTEEGRAEVDRALSSMTAKPAPVPVSTGQGLRLKMPVGWTPPGWKSDEENYAQTRTVMGLTAKVNK